MADDLRPASIGLITNDQAKILAECLDLTPEEVKGFTLCELLVDLALLVKAIVTLPDRR